MYWHGFLKWVPRRVLIMEQEALTFPDPPLSQPVYIVVCGSLFHCKWLFSCELSLLGRSEIQDDRHRKICFFLIKRNININTRLFLENADLILLLFLGDHMCKFIKHCF
jgi:hypothetical protein